MLQTFTRDDTLREQYRLQEEFIRVQRTEQARAKRLTERYNRGQREKEKALKDKEKALKDKEKALKAQEKEKLEKEAVFKELEAIKKNYIQLLKHQGHSKQDIAQMLNLPLTDLERFF